MGADPDSNYTYFYKYADTPWNELLMNQPVPKTAGLSRATATVEDVPTSFDWQKKGFNYPIQDQYMNHTTKCGSCWAFAATTNMAGVHFNCQQKR